MNQSIQFLLKDILRGSFIFKNALDMRRSIDKLKEYCLNDLNIKIVEIKNGFTDYDSSKLNKDTIKYRDIKIILKVNFKEEISENIELQYILNE